MDWVDTLFDQLKEYRALPTKEQTVEMDLNVSANYTVTIDLQDLGESWPYRNEGVSDDEWDDTISKFKEELRDRFENETSYNIDFEQAWACVVEVTHASLMV